MASAPLPRLPAGNLLRALIKNPAAFRAHLERIATLSKTEFLVPDQNGALQRISPQYAKENATVQLPQPPAAVANPDNGDDPEQVAGGDFFGPAGAAVDNVVTFRDSTGKRGKDSGVNINDLVGGRVASYGFTDVQMLNTEGVPDGSGDTPMVLDAVVSNAYGLWNSGNPTRFTFPTSGMWLFVGRIDYFQNATGARLSYIKRNSAGIEVINCAQAVDVGGGGLATIVSCFGFNHFAANEYIELVGQQWSGAGLNATYARLQAIRIDVSNIPGGGGGGGADLATIVCSNGSVVVSNGEVVWATPL